MQDSKFADAAFLVVVPRLEAKRPRRLATLRGSGRRANIRDVREVAVLQADDVLVRVRVRVHVRVRARARVRVCAHYTSGGKVQPNPRAPLKSAGRAWKAKGRLKPRGGHIAQQRACAIHK
eukprot:14614090-Alexandrium_andersonii.AAC.1